MLDPALSSNFADKLLPAKNFDKQKTGNVGAKSVNSSCGKDGTQEVVI